VRTTDSALVSVLNRARVSIPVEPDRPRIAAAIERLLNDDALAATLAEIRKTMVRERFSLGAMMDRLESRLHNTIKAGRGRGPAAPIN
jgi:hypothetical protein